MPSKQTIDLNYEDLRKAVSEIKPPELSFFDLVRDFYLCQCSSCEENIGAEDLTELEEEFYERGWEIEGNKFLCPKCKGVNSE